MTARSSLIVSGVPAAQADRVLPGLRALAQLDALAKIAASKPARDAAARGKLFSSMIGHRLVNAIHDLIEVDAVYDLANEIAREIGLDDDDRDAPRLTVVDLTEHGLGGAK